MQAQQGVQSEHPRPRVWPWLAALPCTNREPVTLHAHGSIVLEQSHALEVRMRCPQAPVYRGGRAPGRHYLGLIRADARRLGIESGPVVGGLVLVPAAVVAGPTRPLAVPDGSAYPPVPEMPARPGTHEYRIELEPGDRLAVTHPYAAWTEWTVEVRVDDRLLAPVITTRDTRYYDCADCRADAQWKLEVTARAPEAVEAVAFR